MKRQVTFGGVLFKSRNALRTYVKARITELGECESLHATDEKFCNIMIDLAHQRAKFDGVNIADIRIGSGHAAFAVCENGRIEDFSWHKAIDGRTAEDEQRDRLTSAMRWAIRPQIVDFKDAALTHCAICDETKDLEVDHLTPFAVLMRDFLTTCGKVPSQFIDGGKGKLEFSPDDDDFRNAWSDYHKKNAQLRMLCKLHNISKC